MPFPTEDPVYPLTIDFRPPDLGETAARSDQMIIDRLQLLSFIGGYERGEDIGLPGVLTCHLGIDPGGRFNLNRNGQVIQGPDLESTLSGLAYFSKREIFLPRASLIIAVDGTVQEIPDSEIWEADCWKMLLSPSTDYGWVLAHAFASGRNTSVQYSSYKGWAVLTFPYGHDSDFMLPMDSFSPDPLFEVTRAGNMRRVTGSLGSKKHQEMLDLLIKVNPRPIPLDNAPPRSPAPLLRDRIINPQGVTVLNERILSQDTVEYLTRLCSQGPSQDSLAAIFSAVQIPVELAHMIETAAPITQWSTLTDAVTVAPSASTNAAIIKGALDQTSQSIQPHQPFARLRNWMRRNPWSWFVASTIHLGLFALVMYALITGFDTGQPTFYGWIACLALAILVCYCTSLGIHLTRQKLKRKRNLT